MKQTINLDLKTSQIFYLTVIILIIISLCNVVKADQYNDISSSPSGHNSQMMMLNHGRNNMENNHNSALFKDLSGPTSGKIQTLDVICGKNFMTVRAEFSGPFYGLVFSKGTYGHENCIYVKPNSGLTHAAFNVYYDQCGTKPDLQGKFYENTIVIQYGSDIIEAYDEAKRLRCEWFEAYEKPATFKPAIPVADLEVVEMNFQGDDIDCWMEIQEGTGPWSREVSKIVPVGQPMTIVVAINDYNGQFDMRVKSCVAHDGVQQPIALTDEYGCVLRPKMLTPFIKVKNPGPDKKATVLSYSRFLAFKFPDSMTVQIQCTVEVCRHGCAEACQRIPSTAATTLQPELSLSAKWPAASNQASFETLRKQQPKNEPFLAPARGQSVSFVNRMDEHSSNRIQVAQKEPSPVAEITNNDDMSGSDSQQQPAVIAAAASSQTGNTMRRSQSQQVHDPLLSSVQESRVPQYMAPNGSGRHRVVFNSVRNSPTSGSNAYPSTQQPQSSTTPSVTMTQPTTSTTSTAAPVSAEADSEDSDDKQTEPQQIVPASNTKTETDRTIDQTSTEQQPSDNRAESSLVKTVVAQSPDEQQVPSASDQHSTIDQQQSSPVEENKPSVQADDEIQPESSKSQDSQEQSGSSSGSSSSSLKTVEVEIPANEDPVQTMIAASKSNQAPGNHQLSNQFNSVRLSNVDLNSAGSNQNWIQNINDQGLDLTFQNNNQQSFKQTNDQVIQPRESAMVNKRDKSEQDKDIEAIMAESNKQSRYGTRSQPSQQAAIPISDNNSNNQQQAAVQPSNHQQMSSSSNSFNTDKILIDRSDDSSTLTEIASVSNSENTNAGPAEVLADNEDQMIASASSSSSSVDVGSSSAGGKTGPVVGTEELASGPLQIEDRMGVSGSESLEEALHRLQQQIPQTAALIGSNEQQNSEDTQTKSQTHSSVSQDKLDQRNDGSGSGGGNNVNLVASDNGKSTEHSQQQQNVIDQRSDSQTNKNLGQREQVAANHQPSSNQRGEISQPFPNIYGQAKVIADPNNGRGHLSMLAQASNVEGSPVVLPANSAHHQNQSGIPRSTQFSMSAGEQMNQHLSKPVAQITNVPINIGLSQSRMPAIQQLSQQIAYFQQQQQQHHQQQLQKQTSASQQTSATPPVNSGLNSKPSKSRFSLLSPQAALQAVASRFLGKPTQHLSSQQSNPSAQQQVINNIPLSFEQQQRLFLAGQQQQQQPQQHTQANQFNVLQQQQQQKQGGLSNLPQQATSLRPQQQSSAVSLFGRLTNNQPLVRSRRSPIEPKGKKGNGEVGITKTFMVVNGLDLNFLPNDTETQLPPILEGRRLPEDEGEVIYGVCMPIVSLTFVLTCAFWLVVFLSSFCIYMLIKSRRQQSTLKSEKENGLISS